VTPFSEEQLRSAANLAQFYDALLSRGAPSLVPMIQLDSVLPLYRDACEE